MIDRYREFLPVSASTPIVSLGEGNTPLIYCQRLSKRVGRGCRVFVKNEGVNPTGSFKDRGMTVAVSKALERGARAIICASTGNTSASASAYAAIWRLTRDPAASVAFLKSRLIVPEVPRAERGAVGVGESGLAQQASRRIPALRPDVAIFDARLPDGSGIDVCREVRSVDISAGVRHHLDLPDIEHGNSLLLGGEVTG